MFKPWLCLYCCVWGHLSVPGIPWQGTEPLPESLWCLGCCSCWGVKFAFQGTPLSLCWCVMGSEGPKCHIRVIRAASPVWSTGPGCLSPSVAPGPPAGPSEHRQMARAEAEPCQLCVIRARWSKHWARQKSLFFMKKQKAKIYSEKTTGFAPFQGQDFSGCCWCLAQEEPGQDVWLPGWPRLGFVSWFIKETLLVYLGK